MEYTTVLWAVVVMHCMVRQECYTYQQGGGRACVLDAGDEQDERRGMRAVARTVSRYGNARKDYISYSSPYTLLLLSVHFFLLPSTHKKE